jgi:Asp-tRNA(Asn)/Glu-tRNA(Gln) amidotransferase A subunit family amidase
VEDLKLVMQALYSERTFEIDPYVFPLPFNDTDYTDFSTRTNLKIGYFTSNGIFQCCDSVIRAVTMTKEKLESLGHTVVEFEVPEPERMMSDFVKMLFCDGGLGMDDALKGEAPEWFYKTSVTLDKHPYLKPLVFGLSGALGFSRMTKYFKELKVLSS